MRGEALQQNKINKFSSNECCDVGLSELELCARWPSIEGGGPANRKGHAAGGHRLIHASSHTREGMTPSGDFHRLNNIDKHRLLFTVGARVGQIDAIQHLKA